MDVNANKIWVINTYDVYAGYKSIGFTNTLDSAKNIVANYLLQNTDLSATIISAGIVNGIEYMHEHNGSHFRVSFGDVIEYIDAIEIDSLDKPVEIQKDFLIETVGDNCTLICL